ncbi:ATP-binding protein [Pseudomonas shirazensis]|uniref:PAS domain-containing sensor histidine kinase n=1 Tax=Pseudomonas shirazensis TaxID=2745494 RepID=UPI003D2A686B
MDDTLLVCDESLFERAPCGLVVMTVEGTILRCNQTFSRWLGYDMATLNAQNFHDLLTVGGRLFQRTHWGPLLSSQGSVAEVKLELRHHDGHALAMLLNGVRRETREGVRYELALFGTAERDRYERAVLAARQRAEELLAQKIAAEAALQEAKAELAEAFDKAQRRAAFAEQMVAIASHDLKNPMMAIKMATHMLEHEPRSERERRLLEGISSSAERAQRMIVDLLDFASVRIGQGIKISRHQVDLPEFVDQCVGELRVAFADAHIRHLSRGRGTLEVDQDRLQQMIGNLAANSVAYGDLSFPITLTTDLSAAGATLSVHNHGEHIAEPVIPTLFEPMTRANEYDGSIRSVGLGLFIVKQIAEAHGGTVSMVSDAALGTTFTVRLPVEDAPG